jgi:hypothetical protein
MPWPSLDGPFSGTFDGNGHMVRNLVIDAADRERVGLFGYISESAEVKNLTLEAVSIKGATYVGALVGWNSGTILSCTSAGNVEGKRSVGGLVGGNEDKIHGSSSDATVIGGTCIGGLVGRNFKGGTIFGCRSSAGVYGVSEVGGLVGNSRGTVSSCYSAGLVYGEQSAGGLVGHNGGPGFWEEQWGTVICSYSASQVFAQGDVSGLVCGELTSVFLSYWDCEASGVVSTGDCTGKTTEEMTTAETFRGWGYSGVWIIDDSNDYPRLVWEGVAGQLIVDEPRTYGGGTGQPNEPYLIRTAEQFATIPWYAADFDKCFVLTNDIDLGRIDPNEVRPIGTYGLPFTGVFDGRKQTILNYRYESDIESCVGVFGAVSTPDCNSNMTAGVVTDLYLKGLDISGIGLVGGIAGRNMGSISSCSVEGNASGTYSVGGVVGRNERSIISCRSRAVVNGEERVGGLVGQNGSIVSACYALGPVTGEGAVGGLVGSNEYWELPVGSRGTVICSYSIAEVNSPLGGGLVGEAGEGSAFLSYWDVEKSRVDYSSDGESKTTEEMKRTETFRGWGYPGVWTIDEVNDYPRLAWEGAGGQPIVDEPRAYGGGSGKANEPYQIRTAEQFAAISWYAADFDKHFVLTNDIDLKSIDPAVVRPVGTHGVPFSGGFDGGGHTIFNFTYERDRALYVGVFGVIAPQDSDANGTGGIVKDLNLANLKVTGQSYVGGLAGQSSGALRSCSVDGHVSGGSSLSWHYLGGLLGHNEGFVDFCHSCGDVSGYRDVGGLVGQNDGSITCSYSTSNVSGFGQYSGGSVGGLVGKNGRVSLLGIGVSKEGTIAFSHSGGEVSGGGCVGGLAGSNSYGSIASCYSTNDVSRGRYVGGLVGDNQASWYPFTEEEGTISSSYSTGSVSGDEFVGGFVGGNDGRVTCCFWDLDTSGTTDGVGDEEPDPSDVIGKTTPEMQTMSTFIDAGWDFVEESENGTEDIWVICEGTSYPRFVWQIPVGDFACPDGVTMLEFSLFATHWLDDNCDASNDYCEGTDLDKSGKVDFDDLRELADSWLAGVE